MQFDQIASLWQKYRKSEISTVIHPDDQMMIGAVNGWADYNYVGISTVEVILSLLSFCKTEHVRSILDFGCGHGRGARHIRACFPNARMTFCDIDEGASRFCAESFKGDVMASSDDFDELSPQGEFDVIWLGSVFTHLDYGRMILLFDKLQAHLAPGGLLVGSFRGRHLYRVHRDEPHPGQRAKWRNLCEQYLAGGVGHAPYNPGEKWGISLTSPAAVIGIGSRHEDIRLVSYAERGWAGVHDVGAWTRDP